VDAKVVSATETQSHIVYYFLSVSVTQWLECESESKWFVESLLSWSCHF